MVRVCAYYDAASQLEKWIEEWHEVLCSRVTSYRKEKNVLFFFIVSQYHSTAAAVRASRVDSVACLA